MLNQEISGLLEGHLNKEFFSSYLYLAIANYYTVENLNGFGNWFRVQAREEADHAMLFLTYLHNNGAAPRLAAISAPDEQFSGYEAPLQAALEHELYVTGQINNIYEAALKGRDYRTVQFLDWFVKEQGEEEKNTEELLKRFGLFGKEAKGLYLLDTEMAARVYAPPSLVL